MVAIQRGKGCDWFVWIEFDGKLANDDVCRFVKSSSRYSSGNAWVYTEHVVLILSSSWDNGFLGIWNICLNFPGLRSCHYIEWHVYTARSVNRDRPQVNEDKRSFKGRQSTKKTHGQTWKWNSFNIYNFKWKELFFSPIFFDQIEYACQNMKMAPVGKRIWRVLHTIGRSLSYSVYWWPFSSGWNRGKELEQWGYQKK